MVGNKNFRLQVLWQIQNKLPRLKLHVALVPKLFSEIKMWLSRLPSMHRALGSILSTTQTEFGDASLSLQHLGGESKRSRSSRLPWLHSKFEVSLGYVRLYEKQGRKERKRRKGEERDGKKEKEEGKRRGEKLLDI